MPSNTILNPGAAGDLVVTKERTHDGDAAKQQAVSLSGVSGSEGSYTFVDIEAGAGTAAAAIRVELPTDGTGVVGLNAGVAEIGNVKNAGTFVTQIDGAALTALQLIDDVVATLGTDTYTETTTKANVIGAVRNDANGTLVDTDNEIAPFQVNATGALYVHSPNKISTDNSTTSTLTSASVFTGTGEDVSQFSVVTVMVDASHDSATDGMVFQFSTDNSNWDDIGYTFTYTAADGARRFQLPVTAQFFRIVYTNGGTNQTHFRLQTILHDNATLTTIHRLVDDLSPDRSAEVVKSVLFAQANGSGDFAPISATAGGNLKVSIEEFSNGVDVGNGTVGAETLRVTIASDTTGVLSVDDNGSSLTVDSGGVALLVDGSAVTQPVSAASLPLPTGAATSANQLADGHNVTVDNASGASAVNIQDGGNSITVDGTVAVTGVSTAANQLPDGHNVTIDNASGASAVNIQDGGNSITVDNAGLTELAAAINASELDVNIASSNATVTVDLGANNDVSLNAGSNLVGDVGIGVRTSGGTTLYKNIDVDQTEDAVKASAGQVYWIHAINVSATVKYLKFYNATVASVTVGTTVPDLTFPVPANSTTGHGFVLSIPNGIAFGTAITIAATTGVADNDSGAPGANEVIVNLGFA